MNQTPMLICNHKCSQNAPHPRRDADMETEGTGVLTILSPSVEFGVRLLA